MVPPIDIELLRAYCRAEISRRDIEDQVGEAVSFGTLLRELGAQDLPLPRFPSDPEKVAVIRQLLDQAASRRSAADRSRR